MAWVWIYGPCLVVFFTLVALLVSVVFPSFSLADILLRKARRFSLYGCEVLLERRSWGFSKSWETNHLVFSAEYPSLVHLSPLKIRSGWARVSYRDESAPSGLFDYSACKLPAPSISPWLANLVSRLSQAMKPFFDCGDYEMQYKYQSRSGSYVTATIKSSDLQLDVDAHMCTLTDAVLTVCDGATNEEEVLFRGQCVGRSIYEMKSFSQVDVSVESVEVKACAGERLSEFLTSQRSADVIIASHVKLRLNVSVRTKLTSNVYLGDRSCAILSEADFGSSNRATSAVSGFFVSILFDPFSLTVSSLTVHNATHSRNSMGIPRVTFQLVVQGTHVCNLWLCSSTLIGDFNGISSWSFSGRTQAASVSLFDKSGRDKIIEIKSGSLVGSDSKGLSFLANALTMDASARMMGKIVRAYMKLSSLIECDGFPPPTLSTTPPSRQTTCTPSLCRSLPSDPNFILMQQKYFKSALSSPEQAVVVLPPTGRLVREKMNDANMKNWRSMERVQSEGGTPVISLSVERIEISNKDLISAVLNKARVTAKISSIGSPFTSVCLEGCSVNDKVVMKEGLRVWIEGNLSSEFSRVFCLVPPISIRFDPQFAATVERYLLELVEVVKLGRLPEAKNFLDFLQISSLQLELHAKEMLGVLALDKAVIHLTRSSVYRSSGLVDAIDTLVQQYREEVVGQWLSLLMRLDVSIGRPVSTARRLMSGLSDLFTPSQ